MLVQSVGKALLGPPFLSVIMAKESPDVATVGVVLSRRLFCQVWRLFETFLVSPLRREASAGNLNLLLASSSRHWFVLICPDLLEDYGTEQRALDHQTIGKVSLLCLSRSESPLRSSLAHSLHPSLSLLLFSPSSSRLDALELRAVVMSRSDHNNQPSSRNPNPRDVSKTTFEDWNVKKLTMNLVCFCLLSDRPMAAIREELLHVLRFRSALLALRSLCGADDKVGDHLMDTLAR
jgi:hypothetical protein